MKRISIYVLFGFFVLSSTVVLDHYLADLDAVELQRKLFSEKAARLNDEGFVANSFYEARKNVPELTDFLEARRRVSVIHFWALYDGDQTIDRSIDDREIKVLNFDFSTPGTKIWQDSRNNFYATENLFDGKRLVVGLRYNQNGILRDFNLLKDVRQVVRYILGLVAIVMLVFTFFFRDFMRSIRELTQNKRRRFGFDFAISKEADILARGLHSYDQKNTELKKEKELFIWQVLPSLRTELMSGRQPPYDFGCTLVRTDINNFSKIYNEHPVEEFAATINDFFTDVSHIVARYNGLIHEFVGDEVIFYFKDEQVGDSVAAALSAIRDINESAAGYHKMTLEKRGYPFTVKSTFAKGRLRFGRFVNGYGLAGPVLIETVRILSHVHEKDGNVVVFDSRHLSSVEAIASALSYATVKLKGFQDDKHLYVYRSHKPVGEFLDGIKHKSENLDVLRFYRSDDDLSAILAWARKQDLKSEYKNVLRVIGNLRQVPVTKSNGVPQQVLLLWINDLTKEIAEEDERTEAKVRVLSSSLRLMENLVPASEFSQAFEDALNRAMGLKDRRVIANALDAITLFKRNYEPTLSERLSQHLDNRVAANALIHEGIRSISPFVIKRLHKMLSSRNVANVASALYALGEIAAHHRIQDPVYLNTQTGFLRMTQDLPQLVLHKDSRVRRQALMAVRKLADPSVNHAVWELVQGREDLTSEVREFLNQSSSEDPSKAAA